MKPLPATPDGLVSADLEDGSVRMEVDLRSYPREAVYAAAFTFINRAYVYLATSREQVLSVHLASKSLPISEDALRELVGSFSNELLTAAWRLELTREHRSTLEAVTARAFAGAMGPPSLDDLEDFSFDSDELEDPLGIAKSWEDSHGKKPAAPGDEP